MGSATLYTIVMGAVMIAFGAFSLYFSSDSAQRRFNPNNEQ